MNLHYLESLYIYNTKRIFLKLFLLYISLQWYNLCFAKHDY